MKVFSTTRISLCLLTFSLFMAMVAAVSAQDYLALQGSAAGSGRGMSGSGTQGNITVEIWGAATGGSLLYNSSTDFASALNNSRYDILLGNGSQPLSLNFSNTYYMEIYINERELDFNGSERQVFQSPVGNITVDDPIKTTSTSVAALNVNDVFNVSGATGNTNVSGAIDVDGNANVGRLFNITASNGATEIGGKLKLSTASDDESLNVTQGATIAGAATGDGAFRINAQGKVRIQNNDADDALNVTTGGSIFYGKMISGSNDADDAINLSAGGGLAVNGILGAFYGGPGPAIGVTTGNTLAFSVNQGFNISGADSSVRTNGSVTILSRLTPAFTLSNGFNISGANQELRTNGTITIISGDTDSALNVTGGLQVGTGTPGAQLGVGSSGFTISDLGVITTQASIAANGHVIINSLQAQALSINSGFNISGPTLAMQTNGTVTIQSRASPALSVQGFNVSGSNAEVRTNGTVTVTNADTDDALNITGGLKMGAQVGSTFTFASFTISDQGIVTTDQTIGPLAGRGHVIINSLTEPALRINSGFNVSGVSGALQTNGTVTIQSRASPALSIQGFNVSGSNAGVRTNGTITLITGDQDDAINISGGGIRVGDSIDFVFVSLVANTPLFNVKNYFNITPTGVITADSTAVVKIESGDADDALNVTGSIVQRGAALTVGNAESTTQHRLEVFDGGTNKCAYLRLFDDTGADWFLFANSTGQLRMFSDAPTGAGQCNTGGNGVGGQPN